ncbi:hypothetical protein CR513_02005, partial [Mucuna pruriens]
MENHKMDSPSSGNDCYNSRRGSHGKNVVSNAKEVLPVDVGHSRKTNPKVGPANHVERVLVDQGSSTNVLFWSAFQKMGFSESNLEACQGTLIRFAGEQVKIQGVINLETMMGTGSTAKVLVGVIRVDQRVAWKCYDESTRVTDGWHGACTRLEARVHILEMDPRFDQEDTCPRPDEDLKEVQVGPRPH